ncbi:MAG: hypothetical protein ACJ795_13735 [Ktedonobacteraceae bacterium]
MAKTLRGEQEQSLVSAIDRSIQEWLASISKAIADYRDIKILPGENYE